MLTTKQFTKQLGKLVSFATLTSDTDQNALALDYILSLISPTAKIKRVKHNGAEILLASTVETNTPTYGYFVHLDVVSAPAELFVMREADGKLFGRGVSDMKFSIPLGVALLNELLEKKSQLEFTLAITTDEEVGGYDGGAYLANELAWNPEVLIVPDGGDNMRFVDKAKGVCQLNVHSVGKSAHASRPWEGKNALVPLAKLVTELESRYGQNNQAEAWETTLNFGRLVGGISTNQVCDSAVLNLDFRYPETDSIERIQAEVIELCAEIDESLQVEFGSTGLPTFTDINEPVVKKFLDCMATTFKQPIEIHPTYGASDARHFAKHKTPVLMLKPLGGDIHCATEWIDVQSTMHFYQGLRKFLELDMI